MKSNIFIILVLILNLNGFSQTGKHWYFHKSSLEFKNNASVNKFNPSIDTNSADYTVTTYSSFNGDYMFLTGGYTSQTINGKKIILNGNNLLPVKHCLQTGDNEWHIMQYYMHDSTYDNQTTLSWKNNLKYSYCNFFKSCFDSIDFYNFGLYNSVIKRDSLNIPFVLNSGKNINTGIQIPDLKITDIKRTKDYNYRLIGYRQQNFKDITLNKSAAIYILNYYNAKTSIVDSLVFYLKDITPDSFWQKKGVTGNLRISMASISRNRDVLLIKLNAEIEYAPTLLFERNILIKVDLDKNSGKPIGPASTIADFPSLNHNLYKTTGRSVDINNYTTTFNYDNIFSPNDSIVYLRVYESSYSSGKFVQLKQQVLAWRYRTEPFLSASVVYSQLDNSEDPINKLISACINPYGGLTIIKKKQDYFNPVNNETNFIHFANSNNYSSGTQVYQNIPWSTYDLSDFVGPPPLFQYDFLRIKKDTIVYKDCGAYASVKNKSDLSNNLTNFKWYVAKDLKWTEYDSFSSFDLPIVFFKKTGKYLFKLHGASASGDYSEWYIDTLHINIPPKPISNYFAEDTIVCRYNEVKFNNFSTSKYTILNTYLWHFGDGITSVDKSPKHIYTLPGVYTISLFYKNGYCDSTLVKAQYIRVVDAPKPGFNVIYKQGCSPFSAHFIDTVTINVKQKDYYFSDSNIWLNVNKYSPNFNHVFKNAGVYKAIQRLIGYSGCVIQTDSVIFNISKGITKYDTINILNSTISDNKAKIWWSRIDAAIRYELLKDGIPLSTLKDTFYTDTQQYVKDAIYSVFAIDSCGNYCTSGRIAKPIFLTGKIIGNNEASLVKFSPYFQWKGTEIYYKIQKNQNDSWFTINWQKDTSLYTDNSFLVRNKLNSCYRIEAFEVNNPQLLTHSNIICIPYIPTIFVPNVFTPNGDGLNDVFELPTFGIKGYNLTVLNRWGQILFEGKENESWNGQNNPEGVYFVLIKYQTNEGELLSQQVTVTLLK